nr:soluble starch synthase (SS) [Polytomella parva]|eukprot:CAMPEP_0175079198 /NCGR_PEP_ID=MMETSP0052_2-20121109/24675_1 /TAXON_ID=51329 ORGANISM="Polytomella parva, Strain SAG 63-3" /NCGR_SAMPLE_ID=MMETSP0052_2 /ASSEMBLY_ACC=CAM_ASM_000194 /LENGTH=604 /DNA_ID=CAMNT_0016349473 /DNA_START=191 /DNA_END=2005 /DNA_ORIENTATION=+
MLSTGANNNAFAQSIISARFSKGLSSKLEPKMRRKNDRASLLGAKASDGAFHTTKDKNVHGNAGAVQIDRRTVKKSNHPMNIVFVSSEAAPWSKTGGLADVLGSLPIALAERGHRVMVVTPRYSNYPEAEYTGITVPILGTEVGYYHTQMRGVDWVWADHPSYPRPGGLYADKFGVYGDNQFRFTLLCLAALEAPFHLNLPLSLPLLDHQNLNSTDPGALSDGERPHSRYGQDVVFVANDWHAALVPVYLAAKYRPHGVYKDARSVVAIHNLRHQGVFPPYTFPDLGLPPQWYPALEWQYPPHQRQGSWAEEGRSVNHLKAGITTADRLITVSAGYAEEIKTAEGGWGMESLLADREFVLNGIVNGIDTAEWDPATDPHLVANYDASNFVEGKAANKTALQKELGLPVNQDLPMIAFIGRLDPQKGADILLEAAAKLLRERGNVQLVCLGSGVAAMEDGLRWLESEFPDRARGWVGFNVAFSHRLTAAADVLVMPSRFEPCGLNQIYAMRYGAVPVAHATGGLKDTVLNFDPWKQTGTGWTYKDCNAEGLSYGLNMALKTYDSHRADFRRLQARGIARDASWDVAAQQYEQVFHWAKVDPPFCR